MSKTAVRGTGYITVMILTLYMIQGTMGAFSPAVASLVEAYPDKPESTVMLISTLPALTAIIGNIAFGILAKKIGTKTTIVMSFIVFFAGAFLPFFTFDSLALVLVERAVFGLGYGTIYPSCATLVVKLIKHEKHGSVMGIGSATGTIAGVILSMLIGALAGVSARYVFLSYIVFVIPFVFVLITPASGFEAKSAEQSGAATVQPGGASKEKFGKKSLFWQGFALVELLFAYVFYLYISLAVTDMGGSPSQSSLVTSINMIAGCVAGIFFGKIMGDFKRWMGTACGALMVAGFVICGVAGSIPVLYIGAALLGLGNTLFCTYEFVAIAATTPVSKVASANSIATALMNVAALGATFVFSFIAKLFGQAGNNQFVFLISAVFFAAVTVFFFISGDKMAKKIKCIISHGNVT